MQQSRSKLEFLGGFAEQAYDSGGYTGPNSQTYTFHQCDIAVYKINDQVASYLEKTKGQKEISKYFINLEEKYLKSKNNSNINKDKSGESYLENKILYLSKYKINNIKDIVQLNDKYKESIQKIIHSLSHRKHGKYIAVNCGAIPEGTIDSELFGHEKGAFTGATSTREGYFEVANGGTIFLDEVGELPLTTQVRLLRILENGEFLKVGSSQVQKTDVRIVAATNVNLFDAIEKGKFREDLYYRLSTVDITLPPLRDRKDDIHLLFRKFAADFAHKYKMPPIKLDDNAIQLLQKFRWGGNIRQLRNVAEQISVLETNRDITANTLQSYLPIEGSNLPSVINDRKTESDFNTEREILYKVLFDMKSDLHDLKKLTLELMQNGGAKVQEANSHLIKKIYGNKEEDSEIDFEEEPRTAVNTTPTNVTNYQVQVPEDN